MLKLAATAINPQKIETILRAQLRAREPRDFGGAPGLNATIPIQSPHAAATTTPSAALGAPEKAAGTRVSAGRSVCKGRYEQHHQQGLQPRNH